MDVKDNYTNIFLKAAELDITAELVKSKRMEWWWNVRVKNDGGLRLTDQAMDFIKNESEIKIYKIDFPKDFSITPQILLWLDKFIDSPYYITKRTISVLKEKAAFELYLFSGDVQKLGYNKALSKRLSQESS
jgi:hypothetical protein|tara:strand:- start:5797 stop:6192 length:396 start_codon:yes stop_codon:yes gene_type:complete